MSEAKTHAKCVLFSWCLLFKVFPLIKIIALMQKCVNCNGNVQFTFWLQASKAFLFHSTRLIGRPSLAFCFRL